MKRERMIEWLEQGSIALPKLLVNNYSRLGLNESEFMLLVHVHLSIESGNPFPTPEEISNKMSITEYDCMDILRKLIQRGFLKIEINEHSEMIGEKYTLQPLWERILLLFQQDEQHDLKMQSKHMEANLYILFEQEFGRPLSPIEIETLSIWVDQDHHDPILIKAALKEAVLSGKMNFRYIDRILFDWKKKGIKSTQEAKLQGQRVRQNNTKTSRSAQVDVEKSVNHWSNQE
ncbi:DnaD domain-containing protein [Bacillus salitolerans]|uniref:DnaD domain-containing protein n=1 Tax=Bacillus salitolerans TaxID=1437434 RepID=A0ABW4LTW7_9BACI